MMLEEDFDYTDDAEFQYYSLYSGFDEQYLRDEEELIREDVERLYQKQQEIQEAVAAAMEVYTTNNSNFPEDLQTKMKSAAVNAAWDTCMYLRNLPPKRLQAEMESALAAAARKVYKDKYTDHDLLDPSEIDKAAASKEALIKKIKCQEDLKAVTKLTTAVNELAAATKELAAAVKDLASATSEKNRKRRLTPKINADVLKKLLAESQAADEGFKKQRTESYFDPDNEYDDDNGLLGSTMYVRNETKKYESCRFQGI